MDGQMKVRGTYWQEGTYFKQRFTFTTVQSTSKEGPHVFFYEICVLSSCLPHIFFLLLFTGISKFLMCGTKVSSSA